MPDACLLAIGNELLNGDVRDKNVHTLSRALTRLGFQMRLAVMARDTHTAIAEALRFLLTSAPDAPDVVLCCGGLGPTEDDLTLAALARALERPLAHDEAARALVEQHYSRLLEQGHLAQQGPEAARRKMATLPQGGDPLHNPVGTAPAVRIEHAGTRIYVLPGVPAELEAIWAETVAPELRARFALGHWVERALVAHCDDEADLAPLLRAAAHRHPSVYLKSLARPFPAASAEGIRVIAAARAASAQRAEQAVTDTLQDLRATLEEAGIRFSEDVATD